MGEDLKWIHFLIGLQSTSFTNNSKQILLQKKHSKNHLGYRNPILQLKFSSHQNQTQIEARLYPGIDFFIALILLIALALDSLFNTPEQWMLYLFPILLFLLAWQMHLFIKEQTRFQKILKHIAKEQ